jgi:hypothetical protein
MVKIKEEDSILNGMGCGDGDEFYRVELRDLFTLKTACGDSGPTNVGLKSAVPYLIKNKIYDVEVLINTQAPNEVCYMGGKGFTSKTAHTFEWLVGKNGGSLRMDDVEDEGLCTFESE